MALFIDSHKASEIPEELKGRIEARIKEGRPDEFGVVDRGVILDRDEGRMYCVLEGPDEAAIRKHHDAAGVPLETVHKADAVL
ncbi:MAG TPA: nickel-binding protein [Candidatus Thermoplasmatota archaeon]|nr:nickel-binding protein [Candidatus Thermoplasmatota archaeon]